MAGLFGGYVAPLGQPPLAPGSVLSGDIADGIVFSGTIASGQLGRFHHASGQLAGFELGSGAVVSGRIASGQVGFGHLANASVQSGSVASGQINTQHHASGAITTAAQFVTVFQSGTSWQLLTEEAISGVRAVQISQSGNLRVAMASVSGRMPAIGVVVDNVLSGINANVYTHGMFQVTSGLADFSGCLGKPVWVGRSGQIVQWSGALNSGGLNVASGGDFIQRVGVAVNSGGFVTNIVGDFGQTQLLGVTAITDVENRFFGV